MKKILPIIVLLAGCYAGVGRPVVQSGSIGSGSGSGSGGVKRGDVIGSFGISKVIHSVALAGSGTTLSPLDLRTDCSSTQVLAWNGTIWACASAGGGGTVTSITAGTGLSGGTITTSGTIAIANTAVTAGSYTLTNLTVNAQGQLTAASSYGGSGSVTDKAITALSAAGVATFQYFYDSPGTGLATGATGNIVKLADTAVTPGSYTYSSITVDQQGRLIAASSGATPALASTTISAGTMLSGGGDLSTNRTISLADIATSTVIGRVAAGTGAPSALSTTQLTTLVNTFTSTLSGAVPASGGGTTTYLRADGTFATPPGTGVTGTGTAGDLVAWSSGTAVGNYAGSSPSACAAGSFDTNDALSVTGALSHTCTATGLTGLTTNRILVAASGSTIGMGGFSDDGTTFGKASIFTVTEANGATGIFGALNMNTHQINNVSAATLSTDAPNFGQIGTAVNAAVSVTANTIAMGGASAHTLADSPIVWNGSSVLTTTASQNVTTGAAADEIVSITNTGTGGRTYQFLSSNNSTGLGSQRFTLYDPNTVGSILWADASGNLTLTKNTTLSGTAHIVGALTEDSQTGIRIAPGGSAALYVDGTGLTYAINTAGTGVNVGANGALTVSGSSTLGDAPASDTTLVNGLLTNIVSNTNTIFANAADGMLLENGSNTTNNYFSLIFEDHGSGTAAVIASRFTDQTNHYGWLQFGTRGSSGFAEALRIDDAHLVTMESQGLGVGGLYQGQAQDVADVWNSGVIRKNLIPYSDDIENGTWVKDSTWGVVNGTSTMSYTTSTAVSPPWGTSTITPAGGGIGKLTCANGAGNCSSFGTSDYFFVGTSTTTGISDLRSKTMTFSLWVRAVSGALAAGTVHLELGRYNDTDGIANVDCPAAAAGTWVRCSGTGTFSSTNLTDNSELRAYIFVLAATSVYVAGAQLELGSVPTPYEPNDAHVYVGAGAYVGGYAVLDGISLTTQNLSTATPLPGAWAYTLGVGNTAEDPSGGIGKDGLLFGQAVQTTGNIAAVSGSFYTGVSSSTNYGQLGYDPAAHIMYVAADNHAGTSEIDLMTSNSAHAATQVAVTSALITASAPLTETNTVQATERIRFAGQEWWQASNTSTNGPAVLLGVNRTGRRELWVADSAAEAQSSSNYALALATNTTPAFGVYVTSTDGTVYGTLYLNDATGSSSVQANTTVVGGALTVQGALNGYTQITKASDQDVTNSTTLTDDSVLQFSVTAGKIYAIDAFIVVGGSDTTGDYKSAWTVAAGTMDCSGTEESLTTADAVQNTTVIATAAASTASTSIGTRADATLPIATRWTLACKVSNTTTLKYQFAENSAVSAKVARTMAGSYIRWKQLN